MFSAISIQESWLSEGDDNLKYNYEVINVFRRAKHAVQKEV